MSGGSQEEYTGPAISPVVGGLIGATKLGSGFMRGYSLAGEMQLREYERKKKLKEQQDAEKALGMPLGTFEGIEKLRAADEQKRIYGENVRKQTAETESRRPVRDVLTMQSKPPVLPPETSEPPVPGFTEQAFPYSPDRADRAGVDVAEMTPRDVSREADNYFIDPYRETTPRAQDYSGRTAVTAQIPNEVGREATAEFSAPSETEGFTSREPTAAEIHARQVQSGLISPETAITTERKLAEDARAEKLRASFQTQNPTADEQLEFDAAMVRGGTAAAATTMRQMMNNRYAKTENAKSDALIDQRQDLTDDEKDAIKTVPVAGGKRAAALQSIAKYKETVKWHGALTEKMQQRIDLAEKSAQDRVDEWRKKREDPRSTLNSFEKERGSALREVGRLKYTLENPTNGLLLFKKPDDRQVLEIQSRITEYQARADAAQRAITTIRDELPQGLQPGLQDVPDRPAAAGGPLPVKTPGAPPAAGAPKTSTPPAVPGAQRAPAFGDEGEGAGFAGSKVGTGAEKPKPGAPAKKKYTVDEYGNFVEVAP